MFCHFCIWTRIGMTRCFGQGLYLIPPLRKIITSRTATFWFCFCVPIFIGFRARRHRHVALPPLSEFVTICHNIIFFLIIIKIIGRNFIILRFSPRKLTKVKLTRGLKPPRMATQEGPTNGSCRGHVSILEWDHLFFQSILVHTILIYHF